MKSEALHLLKC